MYLYVYTKPLTESFKLKLSLEALPRKPTLVIDYRWTEGTNSGTHSCIGDIGNPPGTMMLEIKNGETGNFTSFSPATQTLSHRMENCTNNATLSFSIDFKTNNIAGHYIRCVTANNQQSPSSSESLFYSDEIRISPLPGKIFSFNILDSIDIPYTIFWGVKIRKIFKF